MRVAAQLCSAKGTVSLAHVARVERRNRARARASGSRTAHVRRRSMPEFKYVLVGGGMTAHAAAQGIRSVDPSGAIAMLADEPARPYARPPLSKAIWTGQQQEDSIWLPAVDGLSIRTGARVVAVDRSARRVALEGGETVGYERLLLATGGAPRRLPFAAEG